MAADLVVPLLCALNADVAETDWDAVIAEHIGELVMVGVGHFQPALHKRPAHSLDNGDGRRVGL